MSLAWFGDNHACVLHLHFLPWPVLMVRRFHCRAVWECDQSFKTQPHSKRHSDPPHSVPGMNCLLLSVTLLSHTCVSGTAFPYSPLHERVKKFLRRSRFRALALPRVCGDSP